jgi:hypothetical protein
MWPSSRLRKRPSICSPHGGASRRPATPRFRPLLEALEDRWLPAQIGLSVSSLADAGPGTLREALLWADAGRQSDKFAIGFAVSGTIDLQSPLPDLNNSISIQGPGAGSLTVERAAGASFASAIVTVDAGRTASLSGLTIANGNAGGILNSGTLAVSGCTISGNTAADGGGILNNEFATLTVSGCTLSDNSAQGGPFASGGGIFNAEGGTLTVSSSILSGNSAVGLEARGGAIANGLATATVSGCTLSGNSAAGLEARGGGISNDGTLLVSDNSNLSGNAATLGGGIYNFNGSKQTLTVSGSTVCGNSATLGGGIFNDIGGTLKVSNNSALSGNTATSGGGLFNAGTAMLQDSSLSANTAEEGGGVYNDAFGALTVQGGNLTGNAAGDLGGGLYNLGTATVQEGTLSGNTAGFAGGGIFNGASGTLAVKESTVLHNVAPSGADLHNLGALTLNDSTVGVISP